MRRLFACVRTAIVGPLFIALWTIWLPGLFGGSRPFDDPRPGGWIVVALGAVIVIPAMALFAWRGFGTPAPFDAPRHLVISGPYRFVRNPMYTGMTLVLAGEAIVYPHLTQPLLVELLVFVALAVVFVLAYEEPVLRQKFGGDYADYCRHVRRWIPRLSRFDNPSNAAVQ